MSVGNLARTGLGGLFAAVIMFGASLGLWVGTPLLWLWVGSQVQGATDNLSLALLVMFAGVVLSVGVIGWLLITLSRLHRDNAVARGTRDPGHQMLERVLVASAGVAITVFGIWFLLFAGASPIPIGLNF